MWDSSWVPAHALSRKAPMFAIVQCILKRNKLKKHDMWLSNESPIWIESELLNTPMVLYGFIICSVPNPLGKSWESGVREARCWVFHCSCPPAVQFPRWRNALKSWRRSCSCSALAWDGWIHQPYLLGFHEEKWCYHADNISWNTTDTYDIWIICCFWCWLLVEFGDTLW